MSTFTTRTEAEVRSIAERFLSANQPPNYRLVVKGIRASEPLQEWVVWVDSEPEDVSGVDFARRLAEIEALIEAQTGEHIVLHPALWRDE